MVDSIDPSKYSAISIIKALTTPQFVSLIAILFVFSGAGFWLANYQAENRVSGAQARTERIEAEAQLKVNQITSENIQLQSEIKDIESKLVDFKSANDEWKKLYEQQLNIISLKNRDLEKLSSSLGKVSNCSFIHSQIIATKNEMKSVKSFVIFSGRAENKEELAVLENRLALFQEQLGTCNK